MNAKNNIRKHVCMVAYTAYPYDARVRREAETIASLDGYSVICFLPKSGATAVSTVLNNVSLIELRTRQYQGKSKLKYLISYLQFTCFAFLACIRLLVQGKIDIVHVHNMPNFLVFAGLVPKLFGKKIILDIHDTIIETYGAKFGNNSSLLLRLFRVEEKICCSFANRIISVNHPQKDMLVSRGIPAKKIVISMNIPDPVLFGGGGQETQQKKDGVKLIYHGTLVMRLGIDLAIRAVVRAVAQVPGIEFHIVGTGDDRDFFENLIQELNAQTYIHLHGPRSIDTLVSLLRTMDIGIISNRENIATELMLPVKMLEYIALGVPVVAPRLKTISYYFTDDMVTYFVPEDISSMTEAILKLCQNQAKRLKQAEVAMKFLDTYGWQVHKVELVNLYREFEF